MRKVIRLVYGAALGGALLGMTIPAAAQSDPMRSVLDGAYTAQQATDGEAVFSAICSNCHAPAQFTGEPFQKAWSGRSLFSLFDQLRATMPMDNPGGLSRKEYAAVVAYILKLNALPAGGTELPVEDAPLKQIRFDPPAPPK